MKAIQIVDKSLFWEEIKTPEPRKDEVLIKISATAINRADLAQRAGNYPPPEGETDILGLECSGIIVKVGENVSENRIGEEVCALLAGGGYAEYVCCPSIQAIKTPTNLSLIESASLPEVFATCWLNLFLEGNLSQGQNILLHAGASGIGTAAIQLCSSFGANSFVTVGSEEKLRFCLELGSKQGVVRGEGAFEEINSWVKSGFDLILDPVGGDYFSNNQKILGLEGKLVIIGLMGGITSEINLGHLMMRRQKIIGSTIRARHKELKGQVMKDLESKVWPLIEKNEIKPVIFKTMNITEIEEAHKLMLNNQNIGKIVIEIA